MTIRWRGLLTLAAFESSDHRILENVTWRDLPLTLRLQTEDFGAHDGASPVGSIDLMEQRTPEAVADLLASLGITLPEGAQPVYAEGTFSESESGQLAALWVQEQVLRGVSVDPGALEYVEELVDPATGETVDMAQIMEVWDEIDAATILDDEDEAARLYAWLESLYYRVRFTLYEVAAATLVATPAFGQALIEIMGDDTSEAQTAASTADRLAALRPPVDRSPSSVRQRLSALIVSKGGEQVAAFSPGRMIASGTRRFDPSAAPAAQPPAPAASGRRVASGPQVFDPSVFERRTHARLTKWTIDREGRFFGHLFGKDGPSSCHRSFTTRCERPEWIRDDHDFTDFHVGDAHLSSGEVLRVGVLTYAALHAPDGRLTPEELIRLMEDTGSQLGPVRLHVDEFGVQACGQVYDDVTPAQCARALAGFPSYDGRKVSGRWRLFGLHVVNTPGHAVYEEDGETVRMVASMAPAVGPLAEAALLASGAPDCGGACGGQDAGSCGCHGPARVSPAKLADLAHLDSAMAARGSRR